MEKTETIGVGLIIIGLLLMLPHGFFEAIFITAGTTLLITTHHNKNRSAQT